MSLQGTVAEWDASQVMRDRVRCGGQLLVPAEYEAEPRATVACAEQNFDFFKPLMKRLKASDGSVGMHTVPHIMAQTLGLPNSFFTYRSWVLNAFESLRVRRISVAARCQDQEALYEVEGDGAKQGSLEEDGKGGQGHVRAREAEASKRTAPSLPGVQTFAGAGL